MYMRALPLEFPAFRLKLAILSPLLLNLRAALESPSSTGPSALRLRRTSLMPSSIANTFTGSFMLSPQPRLSGRLASSISGLRTGTLFSALPKAPSWPATTIILTLPTYIGSFMR